MAIARTVDLVLNAARTPGQILLASRTDPTTAETPVWIQGDRFEARLRFVSPAAEIGGTPTVETIEAGSTIALAGRVGDVQVFTAAGFAETGTGDDLHYAAIVNLRTDELVTLLADDEQVTVVVDVEVDDGVAETENLTWQFQVVVRREARISGATPTPAIPPYPVAPVANTTLGASAGGGWVQRTAEQQREHLEVLSADEAMAKTDPVTEEQLPEAVIAALRSGTDAELQATTLAVAEPGVVKSDPVARKNDVPSIGGPGYGAGGRPLDSFYRDGIPLDLVVIDGRGTGTSATALYSSVPAAASAATLPFTALLPRIEFPEMSPAASSWVFASSGSTTLTTSSNTFGLGFSAPADAIFLALYGAGSGDYRRVEFDPGLLWGYHGRAAVTFDHAAAPDLWVRGRKLAGSEFTLGAAPAWSATMANSYWHLHGQPTGLTPMPGRVAPHIIVLGVLSALELYDWTRFGLLPAWAMLGGNAVAQTSGTLIVGARYRITGAGGTFPGADTNAVGEEFIATATAATWGGASVVRLGVVCAPVVGPANCIGLHDRSGNAANTVVRGGAPILSDRREGIIEAEVTFAASTAAQYLVIANQLWSDRHARIDAIVLTATAATTGDGASLGRAGASGSFVDTEPLAANVPADFAPVARMIDPTNRQLQITPDSVPYTGTIRAWIRWSRTRTP